MSESPTRGYAVQVNEEADGSWTVAVPDLPGALAAAAGPAEALAEVGDAIDAWIAAARADGVTVPLPRPRRTSSADASSCASRGASIEPRRSERPARA